MFLLITYMLDCAKSSKTIMINWDQHFCDMNKFWHEYLRLRYNNSDYYTFHVDTIFSMKSWHTCLKTFYNSFPKHYSINPKIKHAVFQSDILGKGKQHTCHRLMQIQRWCWSQQSTYEMTLWCLQYEKIYDQVYEKDYYMHSIESSFYIIKLCT